MHPHTKFGIRTSKILGDMHQTQRGTEGRCDYYMPPKVPSGGIKTLHNLENPTCDPLKYTMGSPVLIVSTCMVKSIGIQRVKSLTKFEKKIKKKRYQI